ncbi:hypothetical protein F5Y05DRAFT_310514 [Hypoxylon sp. FL0543]|nr:hypothetical protein F5Y05DRAFT_310514 [Hypoxylon sp. FL0543]
MTEQEGIAYCAARVDPITHVQVADFSQVQYLNIEDSEPEVEAGENEPDEDDVNEGQSEPTTPQIPLIPIPSPAVKSHKGKKEKHSKVEPEVPVPAKTAPPLTGKKRKNAKKKEKEKEKKKKQQEKAKNNANNEAMNMEPNAEPSEQSQPPAAAVTPEQSPLPIKNRRATAIHDPILEHQTKMKEAKGRRRKTLLRQIPRRQPSPLIHHLWRSPMNQRHHL